MKKIRAITTQMLQAVKDMFYIWWLEMKNTVKDEGVLIFFVLVPLGYSILYSWIYNNEVLHNVPVAVVDLSHSELSREFLRRVNSTPDVKTAYYCNNLQEARNLIGRQEAHGVILIPEDFNRTIERGEQAHISIYCDMSLMLCYKAIYQSALSISQVINANIQKPQSMSTTERDEEVATEPIVVDNVAMFNTTGGYCNSLMPAVLILIIQQTLLLGIGLAAGTARENNRYRDLVPISQHYNGIFRIVCGKSLCYFMIYMVMSAYMLLLVPHWFDLTQMVTFRSFLLFVLPYLLACIFFGMTISCLIRYRENVMLMVVFTSVPMLFLSGISWPKESIPSFWQGISWLVPSTFGIRGFVRLNSLGATMSDIATEYKALWIQALVYCFTTCLVYRFQIRNAYKHANAHIDKIQEKLKARQSQVEAEQPQSESTSEVLSSATATAAMLAEAASALAESSSSESSESANESSKSSNESSETAAESSEAVADAHIESEVEPIASDATESVESTMESVESSNELDEEESEPSEDVAEASESPSEPTESATEEPSASLEEESSEPTEESSDSAEEPLKSTEDPVAEKLDDDSAQQESSENDSEVTDA